MSTLKDAALRGGSWSAIAQVVTVTLQMLQMIVLARLLRPEDFGLVAMCTVVLGFARTFQDMGVSNAIIHRQDVSRDELSTLYWTNVLVGTVVTLALGLAAPAVAAFFEEPRLTVLTLWLSLSLLFTSLGQQFAILLQKHLRFRALAFVRVFSVLVGTVVAIGTASLGQGAFSLVWGQLTTALAMSLGLAAVGIRSWCPCVHFRIADLRRYLSFGLYQVGERCVNYYATSIDTILIGRLLGSEVLGVYNIAYNLIVVPLRGINPILTKVAFPIMARKQHDDRALRRGYTEMVRFLSFVTVPMLAGLALTAPLFVPVVFGAHWSSAIPIVQVLSIVGILKSLGNPIGSVLLAKGRADIGFKWNLFVAAVNTLVFFVAAHFSLLTVAISYACVAVVYWFGNRVILKRTIHLSWTEYLQAVVAPVACTVPMILAVYGCLRATSSLDWPQTAKLAAVVGIGTIIYASVAGFFSYHYWHDLTTSLLGRKQRSV